MRGHRGYGNQDEIDKDKQKRVGIFINTVYGSERKRL